LPPCFMCSSPCAPIILTDLIARWKPCI
jgi:hypothetical protein